MLFNSLEYLIFLPLVVALYFATPAKWRWLLLLVASYYFYMSWKAAYVILIMVTTLVDYWVALQIGKAPDKKKKKRFLVLSLVVNLGILASFKYLDFMTGSLNMAFREFNIFHPLPLFHILLPVGISFYIFQSLSYTIDVYRGIKEPEKHVGKFALYVAYFPQLVAGPIERSTSLLPQIHETHHFDQQKLISGVKLILWGFFKKLVIADRLGMFVSKIYEHPGDHTGLPVILATGLFAFQLYCDFSGYTDIARGSARTMGFDLMINFNRPMIAKSMRDFWNRWHISLTTWFRDYLLYSLPYIKGTKVLYWRLYLNLVITFLLMGLWHGAAWTFVLFGLYHGLLLVLETVTDNQRARISAAIHLDDLGPVKKILGNLFTFSLLAFSLYFFRADTIGDSFRFMADSLDFSNTAASIREILKDNEVLFGMLMIIVLLVAEQVHEKHDLVRLIASRPLLIRWAVYIGFIFFVVIFGVLQKEKFIYFQF